MAGGGQAPAHGGGDAPSLVASDMFTPGRAGGRDVLVWEGSVAAPASPLGWHSSSPVEVFFHTGYHRATRELASEFTRQLDRQLSALSLLSVERLLEGIRAYRTQGRQPTSKATRKRREEFMEQVVDDLTRVHHLSWEDAQAKTLEVDRALVVLHEPDQLLAGPGGPATAAQGWPSLGHGSVNSSVGSQNRPMVTVLEQAALQVPPEQRSRVRLLLRAVLTASPALAHRLRHGQVVLEPRTREQVSATSPRGPPWTPAHVAATLAADRDPWDPPPRGQEPGQDRPGAGQPHQPGRAGPATGQPGPTTGEPPTRTGATPAGPLQTGQPDRPGQPPQADGPGQPGHKITREEVLADIAAQVAQDTRGRRGAPAGAARAASLREASFPHPPTAAVRTPPVREGAPPRTNRPGQPGHKITPEEILADIKAHAAQTAQQPAQARTPRQTPTRRRRRNRGLGR